MNMTVLHDDEIPIDVGLVRKLVDTEFPQYAKLPLSRLGATGSTNSLFRLGDDLLVRLPRQPGNGAVIEREQRLAGEFGPRLPIRVPQILALGQPGHGYSERWSIVEWLPGEHPTACGPDEPPSRQGAQLAVDLAELIIALREAPLPDAAAQDPALRGYRGGALAGIDDWTRNSIEQCRSIVGFDLDLDLALAIWKDALKLSGAYEAGPDCWYHGDLVAENLLVTDDRLSAVIDFGVGIGDPTIDLHGAWELFDQPAREIFRERIGAEDAEWLRGRGWALGLALGTFTYYWHTMPSRREDRLMMARNVLADAQ
ncbi:aminoglycoside phosphotransferase family protein [Kribbella sp. NBC_00709]|uniref:aminoglycoside phosphotransferase family protein n=1 Tax=Kribbella sp. NBC_00709 TaxID=2975972 RepID=UPI002E2A8711|nr:aminoglycoside phosphotransferase family protein [Kribbella sp. NBC_00709]